MKNKNQQLSLKVRPLLSLLCAYTSKKDTRAGIHLTWYVYNKPIGTYTRYYNPISVSQSNQKLIYLTWLASTLV